MNLTEMHTLFRVEAGPGIGLGHLSRCLGLAAWLKETGSDCGFVMTGPDKDIRSRVESRGFRILERNPILKPGSRGDAQELLGLAAGTDASWRLTMSPVSSHRLFHAQLVGRVNGLPA